MLKSLKVLGAGFFFAVVAATTFVPSASADELRWRVTNDSQWIAYLEFFSPEHDRVWPGNNRHYVLDETGPYTFNLACTTGEKICFGAYTNGSRYWGVGEYGDEGCTRCCYTCGSGTARITLTD